uniref:Uncharacterized protein n=1 Tax=Klebsiella pneumoniae TaxID=573 RepID=A0A2P1BNP6_KLEPN|nr:hypothetical protein [Klebsiella pneumoniae]
MLNAFFSLIRSEFLNHHPLSCRGRGFDFVRGPAEPAPGYNLHPFESRSPQGRKRAQPGADVRGEREIFRPNEAAAEWPGKIYCERPCRPRTARRVVLVSAPANGLKRVIRVPGKGAGTRRNDGTRARNGVARRVPAVLRRHGERRDRDGRSKRCR